MRVLHYILNGRAPVAEPDLMKWAVWFETADRHIAVAWMSGMRVSTIFLGLDHNFEWEGPPILFETMVFEPNGKSLRARRSRTWEDAEAIHAEMCAAYRRHWVN